jgi:1,4-alpha-glucan branching enzyme
VKRARERGALSIVLHTHMPYVEGFGTWPFGEEWLWEAMVGCYLPLLDLLDAGAPITLSLTPVLCDQLEVATVAERFERFIEEVRRATHAEDAAGLRAAGHARLAGELGRAWGDYERALEAFARRGRDPLRAFSAHAQWTSAATHAVLPLLATDAGVRLQVRTGVESHRRRFGEWRAGFWLPECAIAPWLEHTLEQAGVGAVCVELTRQLGLGSREHLRPVCGEEGIVHVPIDRATMALVWSDEGYPSHGVYRDYHHHTVHHHNPWNNRGEAYDHACALAQARAHAAEFVASSLARLQAARAAPGSPLPGGGLLVCALDTELLGHWWYEGLVWLEEVLEQCSAQGLELLRLDDALERIAPDADAGALVARELPAAHTRLSSWGSRGDLSTWSAPAVSDIAFAARACELELIAAGRPGRAAVRELLALQASDWAFMVSRGLTVPYARERFEGHVARMREALREGDAADETALSNLASGADPLSLLLPQ